jgi:hypothetical protein
LVTAKVLVLMMESENPCSFATYASVPSALIATPVGRLPVGIVATRLFEAVLITPTEAELPFVTKTVLPSGVIATQFG